ncbi:restriction endonuclease [Streptococcus sp. S784/96/1]|uniref:nSTAND3 domain-containing NTPase n=1 Tax=Streptococcus sp. S784/96/1 TaxID=2653499 RepID=UPI0013870DAD|nr:restriction endonuclease [Streptococcus sp. S784/96/1]
MDIGIRADGLSTSDFEKFAIELVKKKFEKEDLHGFTEGKDDGIDGIDDIKNPTIVLQAKRWNIRKNRTSAVGELKKEIDKIVENIEKYSWKSTFQYVIVTSLDLTPKNLREVREYADKQIPQIIVDDSQIIYASTLSTLAQDSKYREIFENYKLIEKNFSNIFKEQRLKSVEFESQDYFSDLNFDYFVETDFVGEAYHILQREHILLIQGPAGIGKTTTCSVLGNLFLNNYENRFDIIMRKVEDIDEVVKLYNSIYRDNNDKSLFVVFDDFLGRNSFDTGERVLQDVIKLYSACRHSNNLFICLNSRTQILQNAKSVNYEFQKLIDEKFTEERSFIIDLSKYSDIDKAYIFRKTFERKLSEVSEDDKLELTEKYNSLRGQNWKKIINHKSYFPRLVELIVKNFKESSDNFYDYVVHFLEHPTQLYDNLFENLDIEDKYILFSLLLFDNYPIKENWLKKAFNTLNVNPMFNFRKSLQRLDGSWIKFTKETFDSKTKVDFFNPSIIDFFNDKLKDLSEIRNYIVNHSIYLHQLCRGVESYVGLGMKEAQKNFFERLLKDWTTFYDKEDFIGEKLIAIISLDKYDSCKSEFIELLKSYDGRYSLDSYSNGWERVISQIYYSDNVELKNDFLVLLEENPEIVSNILNSSHLDSEKLDEIANSIESIIEEISWQFDDELYYASTFNEMSFYPKFRDKKQKFIQEFLDDEYTLEEQDVNFKNDPDGFDLEIEVESQIQEFYNIVTDKLNDEYKWEDIDPEKLDYSNLRDNLSEYLQREYEYRSYVDDDYDKWREQQIDDSEIETIESILDKPLEYGVIYYDQTNNPSHQISRV